MLPRSYEILTSSGFSWKMVGNGRENSVYSKNGVLPEETCFLFWNQDLWFKEHVTFQRAVKNYTVVFGKEIKNGQRWYMLRERTTLSTEYHGPL